MTAMMARGTSPELELPWEITTEDDRRFRRILICALGLLLLQGILVPLIPLPELVREQHEQEPVHLARVILEKQELPPPKPKVVTPRPPPVKKAVPPVKPVKVRKKPEPEEQLARARKSAAQSGVLAFQDDLLAMRDSVDTAALSQTQTSRGQASAERMERAVITSGVRSSSGGIQTASLSRDVGGPALSARQASEVTSTISGKPSGDASRPDTAQPGGRSDESIRRMMDRNKGVIFSIYNRALRSDPDLRGKVVFEMLIDASGAVTQIRLLSTELADETLTSKILSRVRLIQFGAEDVLSTRVNYSFDFLPYG